ncbi:hypothetical protein [Mycobacteroides abscessus]|uniref:hypothetical protein n=1 Tax=Mycobacteroides abscessus TaxID=36809 RepID=UPI00189937EF|nr:hypothetical protein [Mycobacteroides abscessus]
MRIRSIKPEFWRSQDISAIEDWATRLLFIGLWSYVDDNGVGVDRVALIAADLFADDLERDPSETFARVSRGLLQLAEASRIARYEVDGRSFLFVNGWADHQRIDHPNAPRFPLPDGTIARPTSEKPTVSRGSTKASRKSRETVAPGTGEQRNRGTGEQAAPKTSRTHQPSTAPTPPERSAPPPEFCAMHPGGTDKPCRACQRHRESREQWEADQADLDEAERLAGVERRRDCKVCDGTGWRLDSPDDRAIKCGHPALQLVHSATDQDVAAR